MLALTNPTYITFADCTWTSSWFPLFYFCYKWRNRMIFFISIGSEFQITEPKYLMEFLPLRLELTESITSSGLWYFLFSPIILSNCSQKYHEEPCKFQLRVSGYFDGEYRKICPWQVIDEKLRHRHHKQF